MPDAPDEIIVVFGGTLDAIMAERKLLDAGVDVRVMPMPHELGPSCGIALRLSPCRLKEALPLLSGVTNLFRRSASGAYTPVIFDAP